MHKISIFPIEEGEWNALFSSSSISFTDAPVMRINLNALWLGLKNFSRTSIKDWCDKVFCCANCNAPRLGVAGGVAAISPRPLSISSWSSLSSPSSFLSSTIVMRAVARNKKNTWWCFVLSICVKLLALILGKQRQSYSVAAILSWSRGSGRKSWKFGSTRRDYVFSDILSGKFAPKKIADKRIQSNNIAEDNVHDRQRSSKGCQPGY